MRYTQLATRILRLKKILPPLVYFLKALLARCVPPKGLLARSGSSGTIFILGSKGYEGTLSKRGEAGAYPARH